MRVIALVLLLASCAQAQIDRHLEDPDYLNSLDPGSIQVETDKPDRVPDEPKEPKDIFPSVCSYLKNSSLFWLSDYLPAHISINEPYFTYRDIYTIFAIRRDSFLRKLPVMGNQTVAFLYRIVS